MVIQNLIIKVNSHKILIKRNSQIFLNKNLSLIIRANNLRNHNKKRTRCVDMEINVH